MDSPWRRLPWTLPTALLIWTMALWVSANFMGKPAYRPVTPPPIDAQLIELPVPPPAEIVEPEPPAAVQEPEPAPPQPAPVIPRVVPRPKPNPPIQRAKVRTRTPEVLSSTATPDGAGDTPSVEQPPAEEYASSNSARAGSLDAKGSSHGDMYANSAARAIVQPMPQIPDDLRMAAFQSAALARFHIAVDGSAEVELVKPTPIPRLNRILLDSLKKWRFMPALKSGKPVASTEEILVKIEVK